VKILVTGNAGYVGPLVMRRLREAFPRAALIGLDAGYFAHCLTNAELLPECRADAQHFADVRRVDPAWLRGVDAVVHLAAVSNDPMGKSFEAATYDINHRATVSLARAAKAAGVRSFIFASSCSMYGVADGGARTESSPLNPLTAYAKSKVLAEGDLLPLADRDFTVTCLRFATACGMSDRLRLDLVVNDFVACAVASGTISILSDGTPWRPLIHVRDMARAIEWAVGRDAADGAFLALNAGSSAWNFQVRDLARAVAVVVPGVRVTVNHDAPADSRSYRVDFSRFAALAPGHQPVVDLRAAIEELRDGLAAMDFRDANFRASRYVRLEVLRQLQRDGLLDDNLEWTGRGGTKLPGERRLAVS
jgi:nucleoside-diphosphate-sugar epimerase